MLRSAFETGDVSRANSIASLRCLLVRILFFPSCLGSFGREGMGVIGDIPIYGVVVVKSGVAFSSVEAAC